jgi:hypothetical protein
MRAKMVLADLTLRTSIGMSLPHVTALSTANRSELPAAREGLRYFGRRGLQIRHAQET